MRVKAKVNIHTGDRKNGIKAGNVYEVRFAGPGEWVELSSVGSVPISIFNAFFAETDEETTPVASDE